MWLRTYITYPIRIPLYSLHNTHGWIYPSASFRAEISPHCCFTYFSGNLWLHTVLNFCNIIANKYSVWRGLKSRCLQLDQLLVTMLHLSWAGSRRDKEYNVTPHFLAIPVQCTCQLSLSRQGTRSSQESSEVSPFTLQWREGREHCLCVSKQHRKCREADPGVLQSEGGGGGVPEGE